MGGQGSGRPPSVETVIARSQPVLTPIAEGLFLPNYSGIQQAALRTAAPLGTGGGGHTIQEDGTPLSQRTKLNFSGSGVTAYDDSVNDATVISINPGGSESDPYFFNLSGSLPYLLLTASGSIAVGGDVTGTVSSIQIDHTNIASIGTNAHSVIDSHIADATIHFISGSLWTNINSLSGGLSALSGSFSTLSGAYATHAADTTDPHGVNITQTGFSGSNIFNTGDHNTSGSAFVVGVIMDPSATPPTASNFPYGTIYIQYTP
jgi:hypothetical protein